MMRFFKIWLFVVVASIVWEAVFALYHISKGYSVVVDHRFTKMENGKRTTNMWGFISPVQVTAFKVVQAKKTFTTKVPYPKAPKFTLVAPSHNAEKKVGHTIASIVADSVLRVKKDNRFDYDGTSFSVLDAQGFSLPKFMKPTVSIDATGTASPEAKKYGYAESLKPGNIEKENVLLAGARLDRTLSVVGSDLKEKGITYKVTGRHAQELQLASQKEVENVLRDQSILDKMRYVEAKVSILYEKAEVIPSTSPVLLFLLLGLLFLRRPRFSFSQPSEPRHIAQVRAIVDPESSEARNKWNWRDVLLGIFWLAVLVISIYFWWKEIIFFLCFLTLLFFFVFMWGLFPTHWLKRKKPAVSWWRRFCVRCRRWWRNMREQFFMWPDRASVWWIEIRRHPCFWCRLILFLLILFIILSRLFGWWVWVGW